MARGFLSLRDFCTASIMVTSLYSSIHGAHSPSLSHLRGLHPIGGSGISCGFNYMCMPDDEWQRAFFKYLLVIMFSIWKNNYLVPLPFIIYVFEAHIRQCSDMTSGTALRDIPGKVWGKHMGF